ncbi:hypothetical protein PC129_g20667 [Phytophthora cactorum]|uniref:Peptidase A2 domain-containing protein n=1 Tax=Phytophthora cactorum TaxID=29920 RepID=A0A329R8V4_9STRA|nr:hypothetical protein Pcac1_g2109 [Phytophthora cactorum]KAG2798449.1 hypothetical protein PC112_g21345 [Phytophthora cactorum]KAG2798548.1 hypothetical protein PC111_g20808 [Phytophthora cactorum]KAG2833295.1 hypothetical protein PC113_g20598 [Phytophthora cactorum]KAG2878882.1 hypothetical protein PC114_g22859 [Phytophthora cactorum]
MLVDSGAEVSIVDAVFAVRLGAGSTGAGAKTASGTAKVYIRRKEGLGLRSPWLDVWYIRLDLAGGTMNFPDEMKIQLSGRRSLYNEKVEIVKTKEATQIEIGE